MFDECIGLISPTELDRQFSGIAAVNDYAKMRSLAAFVTFILAAEGAIDG
jgi:hypothetical protein